MDAPGSWWACISPPPVAENLWISAYHWWQTTSSELARTCKAYQRRYVLPSRVLSSYQVMIIDISSLHTDYIAWLVDNMVAPQSWWACISPSPVATTDMLNSIFPTHVLSSCWPVSPLLMPCCCIRRFHSYTMHDWMGRVGMSGWRNHGSSVVDRLRADILRWSIVVVVVHSNFINKRWISRNK